MTSLLAWIRIVPAAVPVCPPDKVGLDGLAHVRDKSIVPLRIGRDVMLLYLAVHLIVLLWDASWEPLFTAGYCPTKT